MNHERAGKTHLLGLKADVRAEAALLLPWPARTCRPRSKGGAIALWLAARSAHAVRFLCTERSPGLEALRAAVKSLPQPWIRRRGGCATRAICPTDRLGRLYKYGLCSC